MIVQEALLLGLWQRLIYDGCTRYDSSLTFVGHSEEERVWEYCYSHTG